MAEPGSSWCSVSPAGMSQSSSAHQLGGRTQWRWYFGWNGRHGDRSGRPAPRPGTCVLPLADEHVARARRSEFQMALIVRYTSTDRRCDRPTRRLQPPHRMSVFIERALRLSMRGHFDVDSCAFVSEIFRTRCQALLSWSYTPEMLE